MLTAALILAIATSIHLLYTIYDARLGFNSIQDLTLQEVLPMQQLPSVSIIFSALNEAETLPAALSTMLHLDYPQLEIIAINDRSNDQTGEVLDQFSKMYPNLHVIHLTQLPDNWLGKNHALYIGACRAKGDWLLFTDADVIVESSLLMKSMSYVIEQHLDHLTIYEKHLHRSLALKILSLGSYITYCLMMKPWRIRNQKSKKYLGHGAFNLVRKTAYQSLDGHRAIAMECLDDIKLGKLLKENGFKQDTVNGRDSIKREWYRSLSDMIHGLSKNSFAYFDFKLYRVLCGFSFAFFYYLWPFIAITIFSGPLFWINLCNIGLTFYVTVFVAVHFRLSKWYAFFYPLAVILLLYTISYSVFLTYKHNGIYWRHTHYSLKKLRRKYCPTKVTVN